MENNTLEFAESIGETLEVMEEPITVTIPEEIDIG